MFNKLRVFSGNSNLPLSSAICNFLGIQLGKVEAKTFSDGEIFVEITESVRGMDVFIIQSTCSPVNQNLMELLVMIDAFKRASAGRITAVIPYYGYARQDRKVSPRTPITAKLVADLLTSAGASRVLSVDFHAGQIQGFFNIPVDNLYAAPVILDYIRDKLHDNIVVVSPDPGGVERARAFAKRLKASLAIIDKRRPEPNVAKIMNVVGRVRGKNALLLDDMIDTAGTITQAAMALKDRGANTIYACCTHPVFSGSAIERIEDSCLKNVVVTDTIPLKEKGVSCDKIQTLSVSNLLGEAIKRIYGEDSISELFI